MKLPKELQKKHSKRSLKSISPVELFNHFNNSFNKFNKFDSDRKSKYLNKLIKEVNLKSKSGIFFYNLVKEKYDNYMKDIGFKCNRCNLSCCYLEKEEYNNIYLYNEDLALFEKNNIDKRGLFIPTDNEHLKFMQILGYVRAIKIFAENNKSQCFYYNSKNKQCKIYEFRPLFCYLFPFGILYGQFLISGNCQWIKNKSIEFIEKLSPNLKSNWEYNIAVMIFLNNKKKYKFFWD